MTQFTMEMPVFRLHPRLSGQRTILVRGRGDYMNTYLEHYGVKGMKWGVRRYQKRDGSLTRSGKKEIYTSLKNVFSEVQYKMNICRLDNILLPNIDMKIH